MISACYFMYLNVDPSPPMSTLRPPGIIHVISVPRSSPFFATLLLLCIILNANRRTKMGGEAWEWGYFRHRTSFNIASFPGLPSIEFWSLSVYKNERGRPSLFCHMNNISVYLGRQRGEGSPIGRMSLRPYRSFKRSRSKACTTPGSRQRACAWNTFFPLETPPPLSTLLDTDVIHVIKWTRSSVFAYCKRSKTEQWEGLGTRLVSTNTVRKYKISSFPGTGDVWFSLNGITYQNNSVVILEDIGEGDDDVLLCITNQTACCRPPFTYSGNWFFPNGTRVPSTGRQWEFYRTRGQMVVRMNRRRGGVEGIYRCEIPDTFGFIQTLYIGVYSTSTGEWYMYTPV